MKAAGLQRAVAFDILPESKERFIVESEERSAQGGEDSQLVVWPFYGSESVAESDDLLAIVEGTPTYEDVRDATSFQRPDVGSSYAPEPRLDCRSWLSQTGISLGSGALRSWWIRLELSPVAPAILRIDRPI
jgi:hypothetical protein